LPITVLRDQAQKDPLKAFLLKIDYAWTENIDEDAQRLLNMDDKLVTGTLMRHPNMNVEIMANWVRCRF
jgi:hypothetical protein